MRDLRPFLVAPQDAMLAVMQRINQNGRGIALVTDAEGRLLDTVTDGDLRRAVLAGTDLKLPVSTLQARRSVPPLTARLGTAHAELIRILEQARVRHLPLLDAQGRVKDLALLEELLEQERAPQLAAVVMAGGLGRRLRPLTEELPKPMLPVGDKPLLERTVTQLREAGIHSIYLATHYKSQVVAQHFGNGDSFGVEINYLDEDQPRGTAGALAQMPPGDQPVLVINGDILTRLNYRALLDFHRENRADMTVGVRHYELRVPYGVVETEGVQISGLAEKPTQRLFVNAGVYLLEPELCRLVPADRHFDMTDLIAALMAAGKRVVAFPISEYWLDIGQPEDYAQAQDDVRNGRA
jgi:dTDP-glucose pyrophosphorylase